MDKVPVKENILLITERECLAFKKEELNTDTIFIMEKFEGEAFQYIEAMETI